MVFDVSKISGIGEFDTERSACEQRSVLEARRDVPSSRVSRANPRRSFGPSSNGYVAPRTRTLYRVKDHVFLVENKHTIELRTDEKLRKLLIQKYESVMESRYFGRGGIEIVNSGQLKEDEIEDLVRLSYNLTKEME